MRLLVVAGTLGLAFLLPGFPASARARLAAQEVSSSAVIDHAGHYVSPDRKCHATLVIASMGGFLALTAGSSVSRKLHVDDVTGMAWVGSHKLVYTTSPIYGIPGAYVFDCESSKSKRIVAPRTVIKAYPDGADVYELQSVSTAKPFTVFFYYAPDVDKVDFTKFRTPAFLFQVHFDGTDFRKTVGR